jgi:ABC-type transport system involved in multi-copper enzyme maturation permease subunit
VVFAVFIVCLLFAGWFLDPGSGDPARLYLGFVLWITAFLVLLLAWFLSPASLPADIKKRTLFTVVTKPVRRSEIVLGRMLGFTAVGTVLLAVMCPMSYAFVVRGLEHTHELPEAEREAAEQLWNRPPGAAPQKGPLKLETSKVHGHRHTIYLNPLRRVLRDGRAELELAQEGTLATQPEQGHWHAFSYETYDEQQPDGKVVKRLRTKLGPVLGRPVARVPLYGALRFKDKEGRDAEKGINVGDEWGYRSYIQGGTRAAAIWTFEGVRQQDFPDGIRIEMTIEIFRSYKGDIERGVLGSLWVRRPADDPKAENWVEVRTFEAKEFVTDVKLIPLDLFRDIVRDGKLEVRLTCEVPNQYFGAAAEDLYLRAGDAPFAWNFAKGYLGIWLQMALLVGFGVMFSTFLSAPIAMLATAATLLGGTFIRFVQELGSHKLYGGGPIEQGIRMLHQENLVSELQPGLGTTLAQMIDVVLETGLTAVTRLLPDFGSFAFPDDQGRSCVASGFDISTEMVAKAVLTAAGFLIPLFVAGYFFLKTREVAR